jgi:pimeloyl-ACP methyl ester carboxylesterase
MPLVFIHGVNVRTADDPDLFEASVRARDALFRSVVLQKVVSEPEEATILNPYWGDLGAAFAWNHAALPPPSSEAFGLSDEVLELFLDTANDGGSPGGNLLLSEARRTSLSEAIDLLWATSVTNVDGFDEPTAASWAAIGARAAEYAFQNPQPPWLNHVRNDNELVVDLLNEIEGWTPPGAAVARDEEKLPEAFGANPLAPFSKGAEFIQKGFTGLADAVGRRAGAALMSGKREELHQKLTRFFGDVFVYLDSRGTVDQPGPIVARILHDLDEADGLRSRPENQDKKLFVVGHSMGGVIAYDILTHFRPHLSIDALVTVGSQVAVFEEMKLFLQRDLTTPQNPSQERVRRADNVRCWINVFDTQDMLSFATEGVFSGTRDFSFSTGKPLLAAHSSYFTQPSFHERLAERLESVCP